MLAWEVPWSEEPDRLQPVGLQRVGHDRARMHTHITFSITKVNDHHSINYHFIYLSTLKTLHRWPGYDLCLFFSSSHQAPTHFTMITQMAFFLLIFLGIPWWSSGKDPALSLPRRQVQSLVGEPANCGTPSPAPKKNYPSHLPFTSPTQIASHHSDAKSSLPAFRPEVCRIFALLATIHQGHNLECTLLNEALCWPVNEKNDKWLMPPGNLEYKIQSTRKQKQVKLCWSDPHLSTDVFFSFNAQNNYMK